MRLNVIFSMIAIALICLGTSHAQSKTNQEYYQFETYYFSTSAQEAIIDNYLEKAYLPALHGYGLKNIGVFKPLANDTAINKAIYVLIAFNSWNQVNEVGDNLLTNKTYQASGASLLNAPHDEPAYKRKEIILIKAFPLAPTLQLPKLTAPKAERIYELRSYQSATDNSYRNKVKMFNEGGEVAIFKKLGFNAIFYGDVIAGSKMPNLMYMTSFNNLADRNAHWSSFGNDPDWKVLSANKAYQSNVSSIEIIYTRPTNYSDY